jgi:hypothetical protein
LPRRSYGQVFRTIQIRAAPNKSQISSNAADHSDLASAHDAGADKNTNDTLNHIWTKQSLPTLKIATKAGRCNERLNPQSISLVSTASCQAAKVGRSSDDVCRHGEKTAAHLTYCFLLAYIPTSLQYPNTSSVILSQGSSFSLLTFKHARVSGCGFYFNFSSIGVGSVADWSEYCFWARKTRYT